MRVHLAFDYPGMNHQLNSHYWTQALYNLGIKQDSLNDADLTIMWGPNPEFDRTRALGKPVLMLDFPYWNRGGKIRNGSEYYKISLNGQHPTPYIMQESHDPRRYHETNGPKIKPWVKNGGHILIAGMGIKAATQHGYAVAEWETARAVEIFKQTDMPVYFRPKPNQRPVATVRGALQNDTETPIEDIIRNAHCVVCHHGNPTVTALAMGVPIFMKPGLGAASLLASSDFSKIMYPYYMDNRQQFLNNISHWQWSVQEIVSGQALKSYLDRGLLNESLHRVGCP